MANLAQLDTLRIHGGAQPPVVRDRRWRRGSAMGVVVASSLGLWAILYLLGALAASAWSG